MRSLVQMGFRQCTTSTVIGYSHRALALGLKTNFYQVFSSGHKPLAAAKQQIKPGTSALGMFSKSVQPKFA